MKAMINTLVELGVRLADFGVSEQSLRIIGQASSENEWFSREDILMAVDAIREEFLSADKLQRWAEQYTPSEARHTAIIMAGNIPLVGFFDLLCALMAGHRVAVKPSSKDRALTNYIMNLLRDISPNIPIEAYDEQASYEMVIATGSDLTAQHFRKRYTSTPTLIRGTRHSVAILDGDETQDELQALQRDIFSYSGLGCRNVSLIFLPERCDLPLCPPQMGKMYRGTYRHTKAMRAMMGKPYDDYGECIAVEEKAFSPNISQINYARYRTMEEVVQWIKENDEQLQCIVTHAISHPRAVAFGRAQYPTLGDYADGVDVMKFLTA